MRLLGLCILLLQSCCVQCHSWANMCCAKLNKLENRLQSLEAFVKELKTIRDRKLQAALDSKNELKDVAHTSEIGFLARYDGLHIRTNKSIIMPYTHVIWNGGYYDNITHTFKAPVAGLYAFHVNGLSGSHHGCIWLCHNEKKVVSGWAPEMYGTMHISVGLKLERGDRVFVQVCPDATVDNDTGNSFSGYLVRANKAGRKKNKPWWMITA